MKLPNSEQAVVDIVKLRDYRLNPEHPKGRHKARVFATALSFSTSDAKTLQDILWAAAQNEDAQASVRDAYGQRYIIDFEVTRNDKRAIIRSTWIIRTDENFARLTSCYVL